MIRWEYCRLVWCNRLVDTADAARLRDNGFRGTIAPMAVSLFEELQIMARYGFMRHSTDPSDVRIEVTDLDTALTELGDDGWELVAVNELGESTNQWIFKRPRSD